MQLFLKQTRNVYFKFKNNVSIFFARDITPMKKETLFLLIAILFGFMSLARAQAQAGEKPTVSVTADGEVQLPADQILFRINLNGDADTPQEAYEIHKEQEKTLVSLLDKYAIKDEDINFQPISIHHFSNHRDGEQQYRTRQQVMLVLDDFEIYEKIQVTLVEAGFDQFNGNFAVSNKEEGADKALKKAIKIARQKAELIASEMGMKLGAIKKISYGEQNRHPVPMHEATMARGAGGDGNLMKYRQTVMIRRAIKVTYYLKK